MKLKTLNDIDNRMYRSKSCQLLFRTLKQEAIKWVKDNDDYTKYEIWFGKFKYFFNITEADLK